MSTKKVIPMLLAASVLVTGFTGAFVYAPDAAYGITSVDELSDIDKSNWAFDALRDLVEKYNVIEGYPDKTFRGDHQATRYEMAAALNALVRHIGKDIARLGTEKADKEDLAKLAKLQEEFKAELAALQARTEALEARAAKIEAKNEEQDNRLTVLEKLKIYGDVTFGGFADVAGRGGNGTPYMGQGHNTFIIPNNRFVPVAGGSNATAVSVGTGEGISDAISAIGRVRVNVDYPIVEDTDGEGAVGEGTIHTRIVGAYGRVSPLLSGADAGRVTDGHGLLSGVSRIAGDASAFNEGIRASGLTNNITSGANTRANLYLESAYYTQEFRSGIPILTDLLPGVDLLPDDETWKTSMKMKAGLIPWREIFQKSPYAGDETQQFQNTALVNNGAIGVNAISPTVAFEWHQGLGKWHSLDVKTAVAALDVSDAASALAVSYEGSLNYNWGWVADWLDHPGNVYAGGWWLNGRGGSNSLITTATGLNGTMFGSAEDVTRAFATNPVNAIYRNISPNSVNPATGATMIPRTPGGVNLVATGSIPLGIPGMGLPAGSLFTPAALAASLGITQAQLANPHQLLPIATINAINATGMLRPLSNTASSPGISNTSLGAYYQEVIRANALATSSGVLPTGDEPTGSMDVNDNANGFYVGLNQELYRGAGVFFSYGVMDTGPQSMLASALINGTGANALMNGASLNGRNIFGVKEAFNMGIEIPMKALHLPWREKDKFGFGYAILKPNDAFGGSYAGSLNNWGVVSAGSAGIFVPNVGVTPEPASITGWATPQERTNVLRRGFSEHIMEAYYNVHINDRFSISPSIQFIIDRLGDVDNDLTTVFGLRSTFKF